MKKLNQSEIEALSTTLPKWLFDEKRGGVISRDLLFDDFIEAFGFMTSIALAAQERNHHPEWSNVYNRLSITLTTHDLGGVSMNDVDLARVIDMAFERRRSLDS